VALRAGHRSRLLGDSLNDASTRKGARTASDAPADHATTPTVSSGDGRRYNQAYFDKWYRHAAHRVKSPSELARQVRFVLRSAEWVLGRPVRTVLDVGCGEGNWQPVLRALAPRVHYDGIDPSEYAVQRFGRRRGLQQGSIESLDALALREEYDLVVCCGMLNYLAPSQLKRGLAAVARRTGGMAYLEIFAKGDAIEGDTGWPPLKPVAWYRGVLQTAGFSPIGLHCYVTDARREAVAGMERAW
jgi:SAM-dependent methyltransferase